MASKEVLRVPRRPELSEMHVEMTLDLTAPPGGRDPLQERCNAVHLALQGLGALLICRLVNSHQSSREVA